MEGVGVAVGEDIELERFAFDAPFVGDVRMEARSFHSTGVKSGGRLMKVYWEQILFFRLR